MTNWSEANFADDVNSTVIFLFEKQSCFVNTDEDDVVFANDFPAI